MKGIIWLAVILGLVAAAWSYFMTGQIIDDRGFSFPVGWADDKPETLQFQLAVPPLVPMRDPPSRFPEKRMTWAEWVQMHFPMKDETGNSVYLGKMGTSAVMSGEKAGGDPEFVIFAELKKGAKYTIDHVPDHMENVRYRCTFVVPNAPQKIERFQFDPVKE